MGEFYKEAGDREAHINKLELMEGSSFPAPEGATSVWHVTWGNTAVNLNPNWRQRIAIRLASAKSKAKDAWAVFKGDKVAIDWDEY